MIPGLNTQVVFRGESYHVQTEDLGITNPFILTLVFHAGAIIHRVKTNYRERVGPDPDPEQVRQLMEHQHRLVIADLNAGKFKGGREREKGLDRFIWEYLSFREGREQRKP